MRLFIMALSVTLWSLLSLWPVADSTAAQQEAKHFIVDIVAINGEEFRVKDEGGAERNIHVGGDTEKYGQFQPGDRIDAWIYPNGHARTIVILRSAKIIEEDRQQQAAPQARTHEDQPQQAQR